MTRQPRGLSLASSALRILSVWGLLLLIVVLIVVFSLLKPDTFPTFFNIQ
jgi:ribose transport system permease protein